LLTDIIKSSIKPPACCHQKTFALFFFVIVSKDKANEKILNQQVLNHPKLISMRPRNDGKIFEEEENVLLPGNLKTYDNFKR
jgi:hypothetical protein